MAAEGDGLSRDELKRATFAGIRWVSLARLVAELSAVAAMVTLARLVPPAAFGYAAVALIVHAVAIAITAGGLGTPIVQRREIERAHLASAWLLSIVLGLSLAALTSLVLAPLLERPFGAETVGLVQLSSLLFVFGSVGVVPHAILQRRLDFRRISAVEVAGVIVNGVTAVGLAVAGVDAAAIVGGVLANSLVFNGLLLALARPPLPRWHGREVREIVSFGVPTALSSLSRSGFRNVDYAIIGATLGAAQVGFFWRAYQLGVEYQRKISVVMMRIALPVYSRTRSLEDLRALRSRIVGAQATVIVPLLALFLAVAPVLIPFAFGDQWVPAVLPAQILAVAGMVSAVLTGMGPLLLAAGHPRALLAWDLASMVAYAGAVVLLAPFGLTAVSLGAVGIHVLQLFAAHLFLLRPLVGIPLRALWQDVAPGAVSSVVLLAVALPLARVADDGLPAVLLLPAVGIAGGAAYLLALRLIFPRASADVEMLVRRVLFRGKRSPRPADAGPLAPAPSG